MKALTLLTAVDCDPASPTDDQGRLIIPATAHLADGLNEKWAGNVLLCPLSYYADWLNKAIYERRCGNVSNVLVVLPNAVSESHSQRLLSAYPVCLVADLPVMVGYLGINLRKFDSVFHTSGVIVAAY